MRRKLLVLLLGVGSLIVFTWVMSVLPDLIPHHPSAYIQTVQTGPYQVTLQVDPNPPPITRPATLSLQIVRQDSRQLVDNAHVTLASSMESMDMGTDHTTAQRQSSGSYQAQVQFTMSGPWQLIVSIAAPGASTENASFVIVAQ